MPKIYGRIVVYPQYRAFGSANELACKAGKKHFFLSIGFKSSCSPQKISNVGPVPVGGFEPS
jgi:hypothetical protein